ncbi:hypothetical protein Q3V23_17460 [Streptomyces sp. VNUA116]|uniref:hypothetical protein n=1 Tax=Streptomyces sp. VNUA116 TaxID=3062449 RepID=UPI002677025F|nr:hypothetical protein [Streptomyces sp. VNUA116]WKU45696.1 hypothetical protein Q3V23_17460 [Streptomyces sp. VNUA116]
MAGQHEYFVGSGQTAMALYTEERPLNLWRRMDEQWEYLSLLDWVWHEVKADHEAWILHRSGDLIPVTAQRAAELEADRQACVRYWAHYVDEQDWREGEPPTTVVRRRRSPECDLDESFRRRGVWGPTLAILDVHEGRSSDWPHLVELSANEADALLHELFGVTGATGLWTDRNKEVNEE